jgi:hypothetical protein
MIPETAKAPMEMTVGVWITASPFFFTMSLMLLKVAMIPFR